MRRYTPSINLAASQIPQKGYIALSIHHMLCDDTGSLKSAYQLSAKDYPVVSGSFPATVEATVSVKLPPVKLAAAI